MRRSAPSTRPPGFWGRALAVAAMLALCAAAYADVPRFGFVSYDDPLYVASKPEVLDGLSWRGVAWAFTSFQFLNWHPLTWLSHQLDSTLFGPGPGPRHVVNLALHLANAFLLHVALARLTGRPGRSLAVAGLFALHPLNVEVVAWISARKDLLAAFFWMLGLVAYERHARRPSAGRYAAVAAALTGALLAKPVAVTFPFCLLLLDAWPLGRLAREVRRCLLEKLPLFALAGVGAATTYLAQDEGGAVVSFEQLPLALRVANAAVAYVSYGVHAVAPFGLSIFYPLRGDLLAGPAGLALVAGSAAVLALLSALAYRSRQRRPWGAVGWLWYLGVLAPMIGLVQVGLQSMADRYFYLSGIGLFVVVVWGVAELAERAGLAKALPAATAAVLALCSVLTHQQAQNWRGTRELFEHALAVDAENPLAHVMLGLHWLEQDAPERARPHAEAAVRIAPQSRDALLNQAVVWLRLGRLEEALPALHRIVEGAPRWALARNNLGSALERAGEAEIALREYEAAVRLDPSYALARRNLGTALLRAGRAADALPHFELAARLRPADFDARWGLAAAQSALGRHEAALADLRAALELRPGHAHALNDVAGALVALGRLDEAEAALEQASREAPDDPDIRANAAAVRRLKRPDRAAPAARASPAPP